MRPCAAAVAAVLKATPRAAGVAAVYVAFSVAAVAVVLQLAGGASALSKERGPLGDVLQML